MCEKERENEGGMDRYAVTGSIRPPRQSQFVADQAEGGCVGECYVCVCVCVGVWLSVRWVGGWVGWAA